MSAHHVELRNVTKRFGAQKAVNQVDLVLKAGESVGLAGHNGAGKSTLIKLILGLITPTEGEVMLLDERTGSKAGAQLRSQIGYLPETVALHPSLNGIETLNFYAKLKKTAAHQKPRASRARRHFPSRPPPRRTYSKGMRQRLALAQALLGEPKVLLFDEPTTGLDPASRQMFYEVVRELNGRGATVLLSTHALAELDGHADRIVVMKNGVKVADGSMDELHVQSGLPLTVNIRLKAPRPLSERWQPLSDDLSYQAQCQAEERMALLSELGNLSDLAYLDIHTPTLDDMYAQFLKKGGRMNPVWIITGKEVRDSLRNRWVLAASVLLAALALSLGFLGSSPTGSVKVDPLTVTVVSLSSLSIFLIPLIAMLLSYDSLIGEIERGTMALLLSYPVSRNQILAGKFIGHLIILALATTAGYGIAGITLQLANGSFDIAAWKPFALLIAASVILGAAFLSMGYLISAKVKERGTAAGIAIGVLAFFVVIFDMALLGILVADTQQAITAPRRRNRPPVQPH